MVEGYESWREFWEDNAHKSGEAIAREFNGDGGSWRKRIRAAKETYPEMNWFESPLAKPVKTQMKTLKGILGADLHYPAYNKKLWKNFLEFVSDFDPDFLDFVGDVLDIDAISHFDKNKPRILEGKRLKKDYNGCQKDIVTPIESCVSENCELIWQFGNHEVRVNKYIDEHPEGEGFYEIANNIDFSRWTVLDYKKLHKIGNLGITHGNYTNQFHAKKMLDVFGCDIVYGHMHSFQTHTGVTASDKTPKIAWQIPCMCDLDQEYCKDTPKAWLNGFAIVYIQPDGSYNLYPIIADKNGSFIAPNGVKYGD